MVHGFGVPHAHLNVIPLQNSSDIISAKHVVITPEGFDISENASPFPDREELDRIALSLALEKY